MEVVPLMLWEIGIGTYLHRHICNWEELRVRCLFNVVLRSRYCYTVFLCLSPIVACRSLLSGSNASNHPPPQSIPGNVANIIQKYRIMYLSDNIVASPLITS